MTHAPPTIDGFRSAARAWLERELEPRSSGGRGFVWGEGSDSVALFRNLTFDEERAHIDAHRAWVGRKADAGYANLTWSVEWGGRDLPGSFERVFLEEESRFAVPPGHEVIGITTHMIAPTINAVGTSWQKERFLRPMLRTDELWCQLFSEPTAGSDLAGVATRARRDGEEWILDGQKVWTSGAQFADWGYVLCRTDPDAPKHRGITAFVVPMAADGVDVRPLRQMTGGASFNEVFFSGARIPDQYRLGDVDGGWRVAVTTLGFERAAATGEGRGGAVRRLIALAQHLGNNTDPVRRQRLAQAYIHQRLLDLNGQRVRAKVRRGETPGPEGSIGKLHWTEGLRLFNEVASDLLGPRLVADTGEWGTYAWAEHLLGTAGQRLGGGTDEVQRNILGERVLGLPGEPRVDRDVPFRDVPRIT